MPPNVYHQDPNGFAIENDPALAAQVGAQPVNWVDAGANAPLPPAPGEGVPSVLDDPQIRAQAQAAQEQDDLARLGIKHVSASPGRSAGFKPVSRTGAVPEMEGGAEQRADLNERAKDLVQYEGEIAMSDAAIQRDWLREQEMAMGQRARQKEAELANIDADVGAKRAQLDSDMLEQRRLISKGVNPYEVLGGGSELAGRLGAAFAMGAATAAGPEYLAQTSALVSSMLDREVKMQRDAINDQGVLVNNGYQMLLDRYGDAKIAETALHVLLLDGAKLQLEGMLLKNADPRILLNVQQQQFALDKELQAQNQHFNALMYGNVTEKYDQGAAPTRAHNRLMTTEERLADSKQRAGIESTQTGTAKTLQEMEHKEAEAAQMGSGAGVPKDLSGRTKDMDQYSSMKAAMANGNKIAKMMGYDGVDPKTGEFLGKPGDTPGRGPLGYLSLKAPGLNPEGELYDRLSQALLNDYLHSVSGANAPESQYQRFKAMIDSPLESQNRAGVSALLQSLATARAEKRKTFSDDTANWLDRHDDRSGTNPAQFGATVRGGR